MIEKKNTFKNCDTNIIICFTTTFYKLCNQIIRFFNMKDEIAYALMNLYFLLTCFDKMLVGEISEKII